MYILRSASAPHERNKEFGGEDEIDREGKLNAETVAAERWEGRGE